MGMGWDASILESDETKDSQFHSLAAVSTLYDINEKKEGIYLVTHDSPLQHPAFLKIEQEKQKKNLWSWSLWWFRATNKKTSPMMNR